MSFNQTKNSGNSFWTNVLYRRRSGTLPTVTTDDLEMGFALNGTADGTVVSIGTGALLEYGFVWATHDNPTIADNVEVSGSEPDFTGAYNKSINGFDMAELIYLAAYATNSYGTSYGAVLSGEPQICLAAQTAITTPFGKKFIEDVTYNDNLLVWNFDRAKFAVAKPIWMVKPFTSKYHAIARFSNGTELKTVHDGKGHRIFNREQGRFTHMMSEDTPIGTTTFTEDSKVIKLVAKEIVKEKTEFYNIITDKHINVFGNGILTSTGLNNIYPIRNMQFIKDKRKRAKNTFGVSEELYKGLRLAEQPNYPDLAAKLERMVRRQMSIVMTETK